MKATLVPGIAGKKVLQVDEGRCIAFMGPENAVYATPHMVSDVEYAIDNISVVAVSLKNTTLALVGLALLGMCGLGQRRPRA